MNNLEIVLLFLSGFSFIWHIYKAWQYDSERLNERVTILEGEK